MQLSVKELVVTKTDRESEEIERRTSCWESVWYYFVPAMGMLAVICYCHYQDLKAIPFASITLEKCLQKGYVIEASDNTNPNKLILSRSSTDKKYCDIPSNLPSKDLISDVLCHRLES